MSGHKLKRNPGLTSIHGVDVSSSSSGRVKPVAEEEAEMINSVSLSELENKIKRLITTNSELFPADNMENSLRKAREVEEKITEIIRAIFHPVKEKPTTSTSGQLLNTGSAMSSYENLIMDIINESVNCLLSLETDPESAALTDVLDRSSSKIKSLLSENVFLLLGRLREVEETLKEYAERIVRLRALKVLADISTTDKENQDLTNQSSDGNSPSEIRPTVDTATMEGSMKPGHSPSSLNITAFKVPIASNSKIDLNHRNERKVVLKCFSEDVAQPQYRAYAYKMPSFTQFAKAAEVGRITCNSPTSKTSMTEAEQMHGNTE